MPKEQPPTNNTFGPGSRVGEYIAEELIGRGGFGDVWRGSHPAIGKKVAIKILHEKTLSNTSVLARFRREAWAVNEINHPNLVDIFSFGELSDGRPYLVMELLRGQPLSTYLEKKGLLPFTEILEISRQVCDVLFAAHQKNVVHRDLKPDNIYIVPKQGAEGFTVKLLDFGIAKILDAEENDPNHQLTKTGIPFGTPSYMSPEQCDGLREVGPRADLYSFGVILFEMLTGRNPFREPTDSTLDLLMKHKKAQPTRPSLVLPQRGISEALDAVVLQALAKSSSERPANAKELFERLRQAMLSSKEGALPLTPSSQIASQETLPSTQPTPSHQTTKETSATAKKRSLRWLFVSVGVLLLGGAAVLAFRPWEGDEPIAPSTQPKTSEAPDKVAPVATFGQWKILPKPTPSEKERTLSSSFLQKEKSSFGAANVFDGNNDTAWCEGVLDDGLSEWVSVYLGEASLLGDLSRLSFQLRPGNTRNQNTFEGFLYPTQLALEVMAKDKPIAEALVSCDGLPSCKVELKGPAEAQGALWVRVTIRGVQKGAKTRETCLSEILPVFLASPHNAKEAAEAACQKEAAASVEGCKESFALRAEDAFDVQIKGSIKRYQWTGSSWEQRGATQYPERFGKGNKE